jgi:beta-galactosidase/beta-glucuronidase
MTLEYADPAATLAQPDHQCPAAPDADAVEPPGRPASAGPDRGVGRAALSLDGEWGFRFLGDAAFGSDADAPAWRACVVPGPWQAQFADLRERNGRALYRRTFDLPADWVGSALYLRFGAVGYHARVRVNGRVAVEHEGGYLPFEADIGGLARLGRNEISVEVTAPTDNRDLYPEFPLAEIPFGKQSWYGPLGGIWQSVTLERRSADHVRAVQVLPELADGRLELSVALARPVAADHELRLEVEGPGGGTVVASRTVAVPAGAQLATTTLVVAAPRPWSPAEPSLYRLVATLRDGDGSVLDTVAETFGFRTVEARDGRIYLNGEPLYLRGALDQDYYPDGICTPPSEAFLEDQFRKAKALGLNCLRCHIKVPDPRYYAVADRVGMLVWAELPNVGRPDRPGGRAA